MKKILFTALLTVPVALTAAGCAKKTDYFNYVSEYRKSVYFYEDDNVSLKIYSVDKETPYALDGIRGEVSNVTEVFYSCENTPNEVEVEVLGMGGEMSYQAVTRNFYLSFSGEELSGATVPVKITVDGETTELDVCNVAEEGVISGKTALDCVREYDKDGFDALSENGGFSAEIIVRLLYDDGCYYYVGVCDRDKNIHAYLVDGTDGKIIAERTSEAE